METNEGKIVDVKNCNRLPETVNFSRSRRKYAGTVHPDCIISENAVQPYSFLSLRDFVTDRSLFPSCSPLKVSVSFCDTRGGEVFQKFSDSAFSEVSCLILLKRSSLDFFLCFTFFCVASDFQLCVIYL